MMVKGSSSVGSTPAALKLHGFSRSSASYRVRIGLHLKGISAEQVSYNLRDKEQHSRSYRRLNPQALVPALEAGPAVLTQSLAILEWLDETWPEPPLLPTESSSRARVRAFALIIACDIHPVQNLRVLERLRALGLDEDVVNDWAQWIIYDGLDACERTLELNAGPFCFGERPTLADICLVPQLHNARRFRVDLSSFPRLVGAEAACLRLPAFLAAAPESQPDAIDTGSSPAASPTGRTDPQDLRDDINE